jgi:DNA repair and recombination protein RAD52
MFTEQQIKDLKAPLSTANIKKNPRGYDYVEGWHAIAEANRIFGFDGWDRETIEMRQLGEPELVSGNWRVAYHCRVRVTVRADGTVIVRDGTGYGSGIVKDVRDAHESAIKEAETDAMKRALMTFGNPFGLALYDKAKVNVEAAPAKVTKAAAPAQKQSVMPEDFTARVEYMVECREAIAQFADADSLVAWWRSDEQAELRRKHQLDQFQVDALKLAVINRRDALQGKQAA